MHKKTEAMKLALEALEKADSRDGYLTYITEIEALREALAEQPAQQEPVGYVCFEGDEVVWTDESPESGTLLYTSPPWVGLTPEEVETLWEEWKGSVCLDHKTWASAIEAKLREKNT